MKRRHIIALILVLSLMCSAAPAYAVAGGQDDPLISKSFADYTYPAQVLKDPIENLKNSIVVLRYKLTQATGSMPDAKTEAISARSGDSINVSAGGSFTVLSGSLKISSCKGSIIDVTTGAVIGAGAGLEPTHRYVCAESSAASISCQSAASVTALGSVTKVFGSAATFADVTSTDWFYNDVYYAVDKGLVNGKSASIYDPNGTMTYAETIKLAACMHQLYNSGSISLTNAAEPKKWYADYVDYAVSNGIIGSDIASYEAIIPRSDFIAIFYASMPESEYAVKNTVGDGRIPDVSMSHKNAKEIYAFYRAGILVGADAAGNAYPDRGLMRSEVAAVINRMYEAGARKSITL